ncbi:MAG: carboxypeptidase-like regulatory domain-containing protein [Melioribacteraceae bacterium]|nr:carboxypeptidase-like regulatory domain-containing protein [Melioribacteraceae bacterium]MCF8353561.1 carboxypeptidase-like regulatory domain-containing protein [Melioribacteraceae bacterium]MCF8392505.1 carboxypeptidase-like regulatory domain-containing protein [Melioribacteraceae bacterium]MCF8418480.1 carboxypeptidase-like regulatory domain-containing protein [Melioribacteraceae bacterium]
MSRSLVIILLFTGICINAQIKTGSVKGKVYDRYTGAPLEYVNVYIVSTTFGSATNRFGKFEINSIPRGVHELVVSMIGYEVESKIINLVNEPNQEIEFNLKPKPYSLESVEVKAESPDDWFKDLRTFKRLFLGNQIFADECKIINEKLLDFRWANKNNMTAKINGEIEVLNHALGYKISSVLEDFKWNQVEERVQYILKPKFELLESNDEDTLEMWYDNRKLAYDGSLQHFLKSLIDGDFITQGFRIYFDALPVERNFAAPSEPIYKISEVIKIDSIHGTGILQFDQFLRVEYGNKTSWLKLKLPSLPVDNSGYPEGALNYITHGHWAVTGVSHMLPRYYNPNEKFVVENKLINEDNRNNAEELYERALEEKKKNSAGGREAARDLLQRAIYLNPYEVKYRLEYAGLLEEYFPVTALSTYREIVDEVDPECAEAWVNIGKIKAAEFFDWYNSTKISATESYTTPIEVEFTGELKPAAASGSTVNMDFSAEASNDFDEAESALKMTMKLKSANIETTHLLVKLYYTTNNYVSGIELIKNNVNNYSENKDMLILLGLLSHRNYNYERADTYFKRAVQLMNESERLDFTYYTVLGIVESILDDLSDYSPSQIKIYIEKFWQASDPLLLTEINERLLEHYARVAHANLFFSVPRMNLKGWETDRGKVIVRYGFPKALRKIRPEFSDGLIPKTEIWNYGDMSFSFVDINWSGNFEFDTPQLSVKSRTNTDSRMQFENLKNTNPDKYEPEFEGTSFSVPFNFLQFRNKENHKMSDVYLTYGLPKDESLISDNKFIQAHQTGIFLQDSYFNKILSVKKSFSEIPLSNETVINDTISYLFNTVGLTSSPQLVNTAFELLNESDRGVSANHGKLNIKDFSSDTLQISDIALASKLVTENKPFLLNREDYSLLVNPTAEFNSQTDLIIYYEIYNLSPGKDNLTDFTQEITIREKEEDEGEITFSNTINSFLDVIGIDVYGNEVTLSSNYQTMELNPQIYLQLDMGNYDFGEYKISLKITDNTSRREVNEEAELIWLK